MHAIPYSSIQSGRSLQNMDRTPPSLIYCRQKQTVDVLAHADVLNRRCTLELQGSSRSRGKVYVNGPYAVVHYRDGAIIKHDYIGNKKLSTRLPRSYGSCFGRNALKMLKPGGRLVAICANGPRQNDKLRPIVEARGGIWEELPSDTFISTGTSVRTVLLMLDA